MKTSNKKLCYVQIVDVFPYSNDFTSYFTAHDERGFQRSDPIIQHSVASHDVLEIYTTKENKDNILYPTFYKE